MLKLMLYLLGFLVLILLGLKFYIKLRTRWCKSCICLTGKTAIVTGSNTGIGYMTALDFAKRGARVILACRNKERAEKAQKKIILATGNADVYVKLVDFTSLQSVREFCKDYNETEARLDILVNNAGCYGLENYTTKDGLQVMWQVNHLSPFLLTNLLIKKLIQSAPSRIVNLASSCAVFGKLEIKATNRPSDVNSVFKYHRFIYGSTKQANILFTRELGLRLSQTGVTTYAVHPGLVFTEILRTLPSAVLKLWHLFSYLIAKTPEEGAQTTLYCALSKKLENISGKLYAECCEVKMYKTCGDWELARQLWENSEKAVNLGWNEKKL